MQSVQHHGLIIQSKSDNKLRSCKKNAALSTWREFKWLSYTKMCQLTTSFQHVPTSTGFPERRLNPLRPWDPTSASSQISMSMMVSFLSKLLPQKSCHGMCYLVDVHNMMICEIVNDVNKRCVCIHNIIFVWLFRLKIPEFPVIPILFSKQRKTSHATPWPLPERWMLKPINRSTVLEKIKPIVVWSDNFTEKNTVLKQFQSINNHTSYYVLRCSTYICIKYIIIYIIIIYYNDYNIFQAIQFTVVLSAYPHTLITHTWWFRFTENTAPLEAFQCQIKIASDNVALCRRNCMCMYTMYPHSLTLLHKICKNTTSPPSTSLWFPPIWKTFLNPEMEHVPQFVG